MSDNYRGLSRREFIGLGAGALVIGAVPITSRHQRRLIRRTMPVMGTIAELGVVHRNPAQAHGAIDAAMKELLRIESMMTRFRASSDIGRANILAASQPVSVTGETAFVVTAALRWADATTGNYDPGIGNAIVLWDVNHRHEPPLENDVLKFSRRSFYREIEIDTWRKQAVMRYHSGDTRLDLGSVAKGYAVDRAAQILREHGIENGIVNVGGDLYAIGNAEDGDAWRVGIQNPTDPSAMIGVVEASDEGVATSGTYVQHFRYHGHDYHHLIDPATGAPRETLVRSFTVRSDSCMHADIAATAAYGLTREAATALFKRCSPGTSVVRIA